MHIYLRFQGRWNSAKHRLLRLLIALITQIFRLPSLGVWKLGAQD